jgi:hypothetical protein
VLPVVVPVNQQLLAQRIRPTLKVLLKVLAYREVCHSQRSGLHLGESRVWTEQASRKRVHLTDQGAK